MSFSQLAERFSEASMETFDTSFVRHNVKTEAGQQALKLYETAVGLMKQRSADNAGDPLGWNYQAGIHGTFEPDRQSLATWAATNGYVKSADDVLLGNTALMNCTHFATMWGKDDGNTSPAVISRQDDSGINFLSWHRLYLQSFEEVARTVLQAAGIQGADTWALPYWEYTKQGEDIIPEPFRDTSSPLHEASRSVLINEGISLSNILIREGITVLDSIQTGLNTAQAQTSFKSFNELLNANPHGTMHVALGGLYDSIAENQALASPSGQKSISNDDVNLALQDTAKALGASDASGFPFGLMYNVEGAAFDPIFWIHHSYIDKLLSDWNFSDKASYLSTSELTNNPWNYQFFAPSTSGSEDSTTFSQWGADPTRALSSLYSPNYTYDQLDEFTEKGPNPATLLLELPSYRPIASQKNLNNISLTTLEDNKLFTQAITTNLPLSIDQILDLSDTTKKTNPISIEIDLDYKIKMNSSEKITIIIGGAEQISQLTSQEKINQFNFLPSLTIDLFPMGGGSEMRMDASISFDIAAAINQKLTETRGAAREQLNNYLSTYGSEKLGIIISSAANDLTLSQLTTTINQNLKTINSNGGTFDDAAYLAGNPNLLSDSVALSDPEAFFNTNRTTGEIAPFVNFRAAAVGMRYLTTNPELIKDGISASPYDAISNFLDFGQRAGLALGDAQELSAKNWLDSNANSPVFNFSALGSDESMTADIVIGRDADYAPTVGFFSVLDSTGTVEAKNGRLLSPGDEDYAKEALRYNNIFDSLTGLTTDSDEASIKTATFNGETGYLAPYAIVSGQTFFGFADANEDGISHFYQLGKNLFGLEDIFGGGDADYDDLLISFNFSSAEPSVAAV